MQKILFRFEEQWFRSNAELFNYNRSLRGNNKGMDQKSIAIWKYNK